MISVSSSMGSMTGAVGGDTSGAVAPVQTGQPANAPTKNEAPSQRIRYLAGGGKARIVSFKCPPQLCNVVMSSSIVCAEKSSYLRQHSTAVPAHQNSCRRSLPEYRARLNRSIRTEIGRWQPAEFSEPKILHGRFDLLAGVHDEWPIAHNGFGYGHS